jgi:hypothetical protein
MTQLCSEVVLLGFYASPEGHSRADFNLSQPHLYKNKNNPYCM